MSWNYNTSTTRVENHLDTMGEIEVEKLVRDADLHNLLSETCCRDIYGAHVYVDVPNFADLATVTAESDEYRRVIQALHLYEREVARIVEGKTSSMASEFTSRALGYTPCSSGLSTTPQRLQRVQCCC